MSRIVVLICMLLCACQEKPLPPGIVASVNGELIHLAAVQALLDSQSVSPGLRQRPEVADMQASYRQALTTLIANALVRQELAARGLSIDEKRLDEAVDQVKKDYGPDGAGEFMADSLLREDEWRALMADHLALELFSRTVLLPTIKISLPEIRAYYEAHAKEFSLPAWGRVCYLEGEKEELAAWCAKVDGDSAPPLAWCTDTALKTVPEPWGSALKKTGACGKIIEQEGKWRTIALVEKTEPEKPMLSEVYGLIENILIADKRQAALEEWLDRKLSESKVLVHRDLFRGIDSSEF